jgi:hypothetical protein
VIELSRQGEVSRDDGRSFSGGATWMWWRIVWPAYCGPFSSNWSVLQHTVSLIQRKPKSRQRIGFPPLARPANRRLLKMFSTRRLIARSCWRVIKSATDQKLFLDGCFYDDLVLKRFFGGSGVNHYFDVHEDGDATEEIVDIYKGTSPPTEPGAYFLLRHFFLTWGKVFL